MLFFFIFLSFLITNYIFFHHFRELIPFLDILNNEDIIYNLGVIGGLSMLFLLIYSLRKKNVFTLGSMKFWLRLHITLGICGPLFVLYHCQFTTKSMNSTVALYSMVTVFLSGFIGKYLYSFISGKHYNFKLINIENLKNFCSELSKTHQEESTLFLTTEQSLHESNLFQKIKNILILKKTINSIENSEFKKTGFIHYKNMKKLIKLQLFEFLFSLWHILHIPLVFILFISTIIHIYAVHVY